MLTESRILICILFVVCSYTTVKDLFTGLIDSRLIYISSGLCLILQCYCNIFNSQAIGVFAVNLLLTTVVSLTAYAMGICAAGDSKLLIFIAIALPMEWYIHKNVSFSPIIYVLSLAFSFAYIYLVFDACVCAIVDRDYFLKTAKAIKCREEIVKAFERGTIVLGSSSILGLLISFGCISISKTLIIIVEFIIYFAYDKLTTKHRSFGVIISLFGIIVSLLLQTMTFRIIAAHYIVILLIKVFSLMLHISSYRVIPSKNAAARMVLSRITVDLLIADYGFDGLYSKRNEDMKSRLTEEEAAAIRKSGLDYIKIVRKMPFTLYLSIAFFVYLLIGGRLNGW